MYIPSDNKQSYPFYKLNLLVKSIDSTELEPTNNNSIIVPKVLNPTKEIILLVPRKNNLQFNIPSLRAYLHKEQRCIIVK